jgi:gliding motility-associated-like protein
MCPVVLTEFVDSVPMPVLNIMVNNAMCDSANGTAEVSVVGGSAPFSYSWSGSFSSDSVQSNLSGGTYSVFVTDDDGCLVSSLVIIGNYSSPIVSVTSVDASCEVDNGIVYSEVIGGTGAIDYYWSNGEVVDSIYDLAEGFYFLTITDENSCIAIDTGQVNRVEGICIDPPSGFSPNGDGVNDVWNIYGAEYYPEMKVEIYNRWGSLLFSKEGYSEPWTGLNANGNEVPSAVYYYIVSLGEEQRTGTVTIKR